MAVGIALGGHVGIGTVAFVVGIGPLVHALIPRLELAKQVTKYSEEPNIPCPACEEPDWFSYIRWRITRR